MAAGDVKAVIVTNNARGACKFAGTPQYVNCDTLSKLNLNKHSISLWIYSTAYEGVNYGCLVNYGTGDDGIQIRMAGVTKAVQYVVNAWTGANFANTAVLTNGTWNHIVCTFNKDGTAGQQMKIYLNGAYQAQGTMANALSVGAGTLSFGRRNDVNLFYKGMIRDVRFYDCELTAAQALLLYGGNNLANSLYPNSPDRLIGWWKLESDYQDSSGFGEHGTGNSTEIAVYDTVLAESIKAARVASTDKWGLMDTQLKQLGYFEME